MISSKYAFLTLSVLLYCTTSLYGMEPENEVHLTNKNKMFLLRSIISRTTTYESNGRITSVALSPRGHIIADGLEDGQIKLWDTQTHANIATLYKKRRPRTEEEKFTLKYHQEPSYIAEEINSIAFSPDGQTLVSGSENETINLWDMQTYKHILTLDDIHDNIKSIAYHPKRLILAAGTADGTIKLWYILTKRCLGRFIASFKGHKKSVSSLTFSHDGQVLVSGSHSKTIKLWDMKTYKRIKTLKGHSAFVSSVVFSPDDHTLISGSNDKTVKIWDVQNYQCDTTLENNSIVESVALHPGGQVLACGLSSGLTLWNIDTEQSITLEKHGHTKFVAFTDEQTLISRSNDNITVWNLNGNYLDGFYRKLNNNGFTMEERMLLASYARKQPLTEDQRNKLQSMGLQFEK